MTTSLLNNGYIEKKQSETDKRSFCLIPTNKAVRLVGNSKSDFIGGKK